MKNLRKNLIECGSVDVELIDILKNSVLNFYDDIGIEFNQDSNYSYNNQEYSDTHNNNNYTHHQDDINLEREILSRYLSGQSLEMALSDLAYIKTKQNMSDYTFKTFSNA